MKIQQINNQPKNHQSFGMKPIRVGNLEFATENRLLDPYALKGLVLFEDMLTKFKPDTCVEIDMYTYRGAQPTFSLKHNFEIGGIGRGDTARLPVPPLKSVNPATQTDDFQAINNTLKRNDLLKFVKPLAEEVDFQREHWKSVAKQMDKTYQDV